LRKDEESCEWDAACVWVVKAEQDEEGKGTSTMTTTIATKKVVGVVAGKRMKVSFYVFSSSYPTSIYDAE
jgi:hypothetical protein